ncbi:MAG: hypothetical protein II994_04195 [Lachnospiraceae bacterium]|nr:hypothetical protein [Lachnospiraceae bacterium]
MKKIWIGVGISILVVAFGSTIAQKAVPDYIAPIRVLTGGLCIMIPLAVLIAVWGRLYLMDLKEALHKKSFDKDAKSAFFIILVLELILLGAFGFGGAQSVKAISDMVNGPRETVIYSAMLKEDSDRGYRGAERTFYHLTGITDEGREKMELKVSGEKMEEVDRVLKQAKWDYGLDAKYKVIYFENIGSLCEIQMLDIRNY